MTPGSRFRAPHEDEGVLAEPPLAQVGALLSANRRTLASPSPDLLGRPWADLRARARQSVLAAAASYLRGSGEPIPSLTGDSILMAGHQPELFHPGVWIKNFALHGLARRHGLVPVNLVVDNDTAKSTVLRFPGLTGSGQDRPHMAFLPYDYGTEQVPYEERTVHDEALFASFADRASEVTRDWGFVPVLGDFWSEVLSQAERRSLLGERFAAARRAWERNWGCTNLEVPVSAVCGTEEFAWFAGHLLHELPRFHSLYNACVHEYRERYGIRSSNHPVPDLGGEGNWLEAPFWAWRSGQKRRGRLLVRASSDGLDLRVGDETWPRLPSDPAQLPAAWRTLERQGFKVRSRALTNTLYARLFLSDLFIHGIGGGKYDELTDAICRRFYGCEPPAFLVLSATLLLPFATTHATLPGRRQLAREVRDLEWNPQRYLEAGVATEPQVREWMRQRAEWVAAKVGAGKAQRKQRFQAIREINARLRPFVMDRLHSRRRELTDYERGLEANEVLRRRDYAFCLYPEAHLREFCTRFLDLQEPIGAGGSTR